MSAHNQQGEKMNEEQTSAIAVDDPETSTQENEDATVLETQDPATSEAEETSVLTHEPESDAVVQTATIPLEELPDEGAPRKRRKGSIIAGIVAGVLAIGGAGTAFAASADHNAWVDRVEVYDSAVAGAQQEAADSQTQVQGGYDAAILALGEQIAAGESTFAALQGQVADQATLDTLRANIDAAVALRDTPVTYVTEDLVVDGIVRDSIFTDGPRAEVSLETTTDTTPSTEELATAGTAIDDAMAAANTSQAQWAYDGLNAALAGARNSVLPGSAGKVADEQLRTNLQAAIDVATATSEAGVGATAVVDLIAQRDALNAAAAAVTESQAAWQAAEDARVAEAARAAEAARQAEAARTAQSPSTRPNSAPSTSSRSSAPSTSSTPKPATPPRNSTSGSPSTGGSTGTPSDGVGGSGSGASSGTTRPTTPPATTTPGKTADSCVIDPARGGCYDLSGNWHNGY